MSQERSEQPTGKRLRDAAERGQVARSKEVQDVVQLAAALMTLSWVGSYMVTSLAAKVSSGLSQIDSVAHRTVMPSELTSIATGYLVSLLLMVGPVMGTALVAGLAAVSVQGGWNVSWKPLQPDFTKLNPVNGIKRLVPTKAGLDIVRVAIIAVSLSYVAYGVVQPFVENSPLLSRVSVGDAAGSAWTTVITLIKRALIIFATVAAADYLLKRYQMRKSLKMTKQEVKEESKMLEGNPEIKGRVRRMQREMGRRRMLASVPKATVVITNPTHFAVALEYKRDAMAAPRVLAKGADHMAQRIKDVARQHGIPTIENVTLARALFANAEIDEVIPADLFEAVAEVLAYLVRLKQLAI
ncbi:MAG: flagellar biosynthesis protein FlhB [Vicinamibacteraceae bacterium]